MVVHTHNERVGVLPNLQGRIRMPRPRPNPGKGRVPNSRCLGRPSVRGWPMKCGNGCDRGVHSRGVCRPCYDRWRYSQPNGKTGRVTIGDMVLDLLSVDGGWLTLEGICLELPEGLNQKTVRSALWRLSAADLVCVRKVPLAYRHNPKRVSLDIRTEWKAA